MGFRVDALTMDQTVAEVDGICGSGARAQHCVVNASKAVLMQRDHRLRGIVNACDLVNADGASIVWAARLLGRPLPERVAGIDLFVRLLALAEARGHGVYFLGAANDVVQGVVERATREHPRLRVCGWHDGYLRAGDTEAVLREVRETRPGMLFVGMPSPRKEYWLAENLDALDVPFAMGVGGSFDVYAGKTRRAPLWMQEAGLEWSYRLYREPRRMWRRYLVGNAAFLHLLQRELRAERGRGRRITDVAPEAPRGRRAGDHVPGHAGRRAADREPAAYGSAVL